MESTKIDPAGLGINHVLTQIPPDLTQFAPFPLSLRYVDANSTSSPLAGCLSRTQLVSGDEDDDFRRLFVTGKIN